MKKKYTKFNLILISFAIMAISYSCKSTKDVGQKPSGESLVEQYCSGPQYFSNSEYIRANDIGESMDLSTSKKKAYSNARAKMASDIQILVKGVNENFVNSREYNNVEEVEEKFQNLTYEVIKQKLSGIRTLCEKVTKTENNTYRTYVAIELAGDELVSSIGSKISKDAKLKIDFDLEQYKKTFNKQMEEFEKEN